MIKALMRLARNLYELSKEPETVTFSLSHITTGTTRVTCRPDEDGTHPEASRDRPS
jgi:hypothetical protein